MKYLYKITNKTDGKAYIGKTNNFKRRMSQHTRKIHDGTILHKAINKYGKTNFTYEILAIVEDHMINEAEQKAIEIFKTLKPNGYNIEVGGVVRGRRDPETVLKCAKARKGRPITQEHKAKVSEGLKEYFKNNPEARKNIARKQVGRKQREETIQKRIKSMKEFYANLTEEQHKALSIEQYKRNARNKTKSKSGFIGVYFKHWRNKFEAYIVYLKKRICCGHFDTAIEAAKAYDTKAKELFGEFANLNFKQ